MHKTHAQHQQAYRDRIKSGESVPRCDCGKQLRGRLSKIRGICSWCWKWTTEGKAETAENVRKYRRKVMLDVDKQPQAVDEREGGVLILIFFKNGQWMSFAPAVCRDVGQLKATVQAFMEDSNPEATWTIHAQSYIFKMGLQQKNSGFVNGGESLLLSRLDVEKITVEQV